MLRLNARTVVPVSVHDFMTKQTLIIVMLVASQLLAALMFRALTARLFAAEARIVELESKLGMVAARHYTIRGTNVNHTITWPEWEVDASK